MGSLGTNFIGILIECHIFSFKKMYLKTLSGKWRPFFRGLNVKKVSWSRCWSVTSPILKQSFFVSFSTHPAKLTHWGRVTHICVSRLTIIGSDNGLSPGRRQAIIWTNAGILLIRTLGTNFSEISSKIPAFSFKKMHLKMSSAKWRPFCLGLNVLIKIRWYGFPRCS